MAMTINTNVVSLNAQRNLSVSGNSLSTTMQRLSSGLRVNSAKDDAAGLAIAERMSAQTKGLAVAARNANDGISLAQTAEGALGKVGDMLQRARELAVQSSNATNSADDRKALQAEVSQLMSEVDRVAKTTSFNGKNLLDGSFSGAMFQVGAGAGDNITVGALQNAKIADLSAATYGASKSDIEVKASDITGFDSEIKAGALKIRVGANEAVDLGEIKAANSGDERMGQVVAAINAKTADTGVTAFLEDGKNGGKVLQLRSASGDAVALEGFNAVETGFGAAATVGLATAADAKVFTDAMTALKAAKPADFLTAANGSYAPKAELAAVSAKITDTTAKAAWDAAYKAVEEAVTATGSIDATAPTAQKLTDEGVKRVQAALDNLAKPMNAGALASGKTAREDVYKELDTLMAAEKSATWSVDTLADKLGLAGMSAADVTAMKTIKVTAASTDEQLAAARNAVLSQVDKHMSGGLGVQTTEAKVQKGLDTLSVETQAGAWEAIKKLDSAIDQVNAARGDLGALQTRFEKTVENIDIQNENISAAKGRIVDADFATETANLSRSQILQQAGTAMVAQANQLPQQVLSLLR